MNIKDKAASNSEPLIVTLDAGGTNFVFDVIQNSKKLSESVTLPAPVDSMKECIEIIVNGITQVTSTLNKNPDACSVAFPGACNPETGTVGQLNNLPATSGHTALGPMLQEHLQIPVYINNDADLFTYGEALHGFLPFINKELALANINREFNNLIGLTLGTGFGGGIVLNQQLLRGDNNMASEVWLMRDDNNTTINTEEHISIRALRRNYAQHAGIDLLDSPSPKEIFQIGINELEGNTRAAQHAYAELGKSLGNAICSLLNIIDGAVVIGGGISGAHRLFFPSMMDVLHSSYTNIDGEHYPRLMQKTYDVTTVTDFEKFLNWNSEIPGTGDSQNIQKELIEARIPIGLSKLGTSDAVALGAYSYAINKL